MAIEDAPIKSVASIVLDDEDQDAIRRAVELLMHTPIPTTFVVTSGEYGRRLMMSQHSYANLRTALEVEQGLSGG